MGAMTLVQVRTWKSREREQCRKLHERRTTPLDGGLLVRRLYTERGTKLEVALEDVFRGFQYVFTKLDTGKTQGRPDYLLQIGTLRPIVVEVNS